MDIRDRVFKAFDRAGDWVRAVDFSGLRVFGRACAVWLAHVLHIRKRYVFTRDNKLRLRYVASGFCFLASAGIFALTLNGGAATVQASTVATLSVMKNDAETLAAAYPTAQTQKSLTDLLDSRLYGKFSLASATTHRIPQPKDAMVTIKAGDALGVVLQDNGVGAADTNAAIEALSEHFDPRRIKAGQEIAMHFVPTDDGDYRFTRLKIETSPIEAVVVERGDDGFSSQLYEKKVEQVANARAADIKVSVFGSAAKAGIPRGVTADVIRIYSWAVDFQRDIREGDRIEVLYDSFETDDGYVAKTGDIRYARLTVGGKEKEVYRYAMADGRVDYFDRGGMSIRKTLMKTPIDGARMSSGFGMRHHPVLGYNKMHKGVDFAAPVGTPIYAAGDGVVDYAGRKGGYGKYVRIRHNSRLKTAYAHMSKIKVSSGTRVQQGQVIGYVGTTGRSTGPHLHYEVLKNDVQVNPRSIDLPTGEELRGNELKAFKEYVRTIDREYNGLVRDMKYVERSHSDDRRYN